MPESSEIKLPAIVVEQQRGLASRIAEQMPEAEGNVLAAYLKSLLEIRKQEISRKAKLGRIIKLTANVSVLTSTLKIIAREAKRHGWDNAGRPTRWATVGAGVGLIAFGGQSAGIAAFGTAIGVPLWIVFGAGAAFAESLYSELDDRLRPRQGDQIEDAEYTDIT